MPLSAEFKKRCECIATEYRIELNNRAAYDRLPAFDVVVHLKAEIVPLESFNITEQHRERLKTADDWSGGIVRLKPAIQIILNPIHAPTRHESTLMHECAHLILKHKMMPLDPTRLQLARDPQSEKEAGYLGGCLQIPRRGLLWAIQQGMTTAQIALHFGASQDMVRYRANVAAVGKLLTD